MPGCSLAGAAPRLGSGSEPLHSAQLAAGPDSGPGASELPTVDEEVAAAGPAGLAAAEESPVAEAVDSETAVAVVVFVAASAGAVAVAVAAAAAADSAALVVGPVGPAEPAVAACFVGEPEFGPDVR